MNKKLNQIINNYDILFKNKKSFVLGAKLIANDHRMGSGGGEWHKDRTNRKYKYCKAFVYLNDVDENNGPFQYIKGSHKGSFLIRNFIKKNFGFDKKNFSDDEINNNFYNDIVTFKKPKGTVIIFDGTGIHRGKPIEKNIRYTLTNYRNSDETFPYKMISQKTNLIFLYKHFNYLTFVFIIMNCIGFSFFPVLTIIIIFIFIKSVNTHFFIKNRH